MNTRTLSFLSFLLLAVSCSPKKEAAPAAGGARAAGGPVAVRVEAVARRDVPRELRAFGIIQPSERVEVRAQVGGPIVGIHFTEGQDVKAGDLLVTIDPRPMEAALKLASANLARDSALHADAVRESARQDELLAKGLSARDAAERARTQVEALAATVAAEEAALSVAKLNLDYCSIRAPIAGRAGDRRVDAGNLIRPNDQILVTINAVEPVDAEFSIPQQELAVLRDAREAGALETRAFAPDAPTRSETGAVTFVDNQVDAATGTVRLKARFANAGHTLWPGQSVGIVLKTGLDAGVVAIPSAAVLPGQRGPLAYIVKPDGTAEPRDLKTGRGNNGWTVVLEGLAEGEQLVVDGQHRLFPGAKTVKPGSAPKGTNAPPPAEKAKS
jgi:multidrug efflux system membrane fusion protein